MSGSAHGHDGGSTGSGAEDDLGDRAIPSGRDRDGDAVAVGVPGGGGGTGGGGGVGLTTGGGFLTYLLQGRGPRRGRLTRATLAGLQHKEMLRSRKRQLAAVLGALAQGDTLALDQALSASYPFIQTGIDYRSGAPVRVRLSHRREARLARAFKAYRESLSSESSAHTDDHTPQQQTSEKSKSPKKKKAPPPATPPTSKAPPKVPSSDFTFVFHSATSDRLVATKEEVALLHARFEEELARQAAKAAEAAKQAAAAALSGPAAKRTDRTKAGAAGKGAGDAGAGGAGGAGAAGATKGKGGKKKKRSALANASNPHHLRNYVPSRLPHPGPPSAQQAAQNAQNMLSPLPLRFLSAEIPPRRPRKAKAAGAAGAGTATDQATQAPAPPPPQPSAATALANPAEEWICPFCEYQLFYGDEQSFHRAVRNRKKILRRRRRARERAAAAASGVASATATAPAAAPPPPPTTHEDAPAALDVPASHASKEPGSSPGKAAKWKEGDRGGRGVPAHA
ncbi:hypothetical protein C8Q77DRAFT_1134189 [Trametes polyzona]|nr:hypothetical protein C8Q77DRAFT_1134189 [Trametes polyzona]